MSADPLQNIHDLVDPISDRLDADVLVYNGGLYRPHGNQVIDTCNSRKRRTNVFLILTTFGGDPHAAYRVARALQQHYKKFIAFVPGYCKSAGTLLVLGAHELVMGPSAELGPLDIQMPRGDEVGERSSVLIPKDAIRALRAQATDAFISSFDSFREKAMLPTKLAAEMSAALVSGLFKDVFGQVDPMRLGEMERANSIMADYGERLIAIGENAKDGTLLKLVGGYPDHEFVIDILETRELFKNVRTPSPDEAALTLRDPLGDKVALIYFLNSTPEERVASAAAAAKAASEAAAAKAASEAAAAAKAASEAVAAAKAASEAAAAAKAASEATTDKIGDDNGQARIEAPGPGIAENEANARAD